MPSDYSHRDDAFVIEGFVVLPEDDVGTHKAVFVEIDIEQLAELSVLLRDFQSCEDSAELCDDILVPIRVRALGNRPARLLLSPKPCRTIHRMPSDPRSGPK